MSLSFTDTYSLCDGKNLPATGVNGNQSGRQQLLPLRNVHFAAVQNLIDIDLQKRNHLINTWIILIIY